MPASGLVYQVGVEVAPEVAADFDAWLPGHVEQILSLPGFLRADVYTADDVVGEGARQGWQRRTIQYRVRASLDLDNYFSNHAPAMRQGAIERFGDRVHFERRALQHRAELPVPAPEHCTDCGAALTGPYCSNCGQRVHSHVLTMWTLAKEAAEDLTHADSRVWRTFHALLLRPGLLTNEFLAGRRTRYVRPFRLYLVVSIAYFLLIGLKSIGTEPIGEAIVFDEPLVTMGDIQTKDAAEQARAQAQIAEARRQLKEKGVTLPILPGEQAAPGTEAPSAPTADKCNPKNLSLDLPISDKRYRALCEAVTADHGRKFVEALFHNIPKMMFVFLPLIALVNMAFYPLRRRYYVVHLLFFIHYHAFVFLAFAIESAYSWIANAIPYVGWTSGLLIAAMVFYLPIYLFKAMRRVFGQGRLMTLLKFLLLSQAYVICLVITFVLLLIYTGVTLASG